MISLIEKARTCSILFKDQTAELCTGLKLTPTDFRFLSDLDLKSCKHFLKQMKYNVLEVKNQDVPKGIPKKEVDDFFSSTKLALILHPERTILFKTEAKRGDCLHEVIHFYQRHRDSENPLHPLRRKEKERRLQFLLEQAVSKVEETEKKGDKEKAKQMASQLQPFIQLQKEWKNLIHWLDEKEVYQLFFDHPQSLKLAARDIDVALANLVRLQESLPWRVKERVLYRANLALTKKYNEVKTPHQWKGSQDEAYYNDLFNKGEITREDFEVKVISLRKYLAKREVDEARRKRKVMEELLAMGRLREFSVPQKVQPEYLELSLIRTRGLPSIKIWGEAFVLDTGAEHSSMTPRLLKNIKRKDIRLVGSRSMRSLYAKAIAAPVIQVMGPLSLGGQQVTGASFALIDLKIPGISGVLGMDFLRSFNKGKWTYDIVKGQLKPLDSSKGVTHSFELEKNGLDNYDSLSFFCKNKMGSIKLRIDSGSSLYGDITPKADIMAFERCFGKGVRSKLNILKGDILLFTEGVQGNLGHPFLENYHYLSFDLSKGELYLTKPSVRSALEGP